MSTLNLGGRLVELSKRDIWSAARIAQDRPDVAYNLLAVDFLPPRALHRALLRVSASVADGMVIMSTFWVLIHFFIKFNVKKTRGDMCENILRY